MTPELCDDLITFSFDGLRDSIKNSHIQGSDHHMSCNILIFTPFFLTGLKNLVCYCFHLFIVCVLMYSTKQPLPEAAPTFQALQVEFDRIVCDVLEKNCSFPGFTLLLGSIFQDMSTGFNSYLPGIKWFSYLAFQSRDLDFPRFSLILNTHFLNHSFNPGSAMFSTYLREFLENPGRSGTHLFNPQRYATAVKECLLLCLCSHHYFSRRVTESACYNRMLCRNKPWLWRGRSGVRSRIRKSRHWLIVQLTTAQGNYS